MDEQALRQILDELRAGAIDVEACLARLRVLPFEDLGFAKIDHHRSIRCGFPEVIYGEGKTTEQVIAIAERRLTGGGNLLITRADKAVFEALQSQHPAARYNESARTITVRQTEAKPVNKPIALVSAGTSDMPVAEEARETAEIMDQRCETFYDVGVAGLHRLLANVEAVRQANVVVVVAGMEGALASVIGGLVDVPVIAVPTSVGYGASFNGLAPLLTMLNSCAAGVTVVNIDNGFAAGYVAAQINRLAER